MSNNLFFLTIMGVSVMLLMVVSILIALIYQQQKKNQYNRSISQLKEEQQNLLLLAAIRSQEIERNRISEILHDEMGAILSSTKLHYLSMNSSHFDEKDQMLHNKGTVLLNEAILRVRDISHNLHSIILKEFGLTESLRHFFNSTLNKSLVEVYENLEDDHHIRNNEFEILLYRIVQEIISNLLKYSELTKIEINSKSTAACYKLHLIHNGNGIEQPEYEKLSFNKDGIGLKNIRTRLQLLNANIFFSKENNLFHIRIHVPFDK